jgi:2-(3-amino-3-carboxypropyl)histidine synthase
MKTVFISASTKHEPNYEKVLKEINSLPYSKIALCYSNQFIKIAEKISEMTEKEVVQKIQILGCSNPRFKEEVEAILIVGQGRFHTVSLAYESKLPTFVLEGEKLWKVSDEDVEKLEKKERGAYLKYLHSKKLGIIVTTKPGQERLEKAIEFKKNLKDKKGYLFISNDININEFENFGLDFWVNTACPRMDLNEAPLINMDKVPKE